MNSSRDEKQTAAEPAEECQGEQLRHVCFTDELYYDLLMEQQEQG